MDQQPGSLDVSQKLSAEAGALVRAFDQAGNVGNHEAHFMGCVANRDDSEIRLERGKRIIRNLRARRGNSRNQSGLSDIGISDEADIGEQLQFETQRALFAGASFFMLARGLMGGGLEAGVASSAAAAAGDHDPVIGTREVMHDVAGVGRVNNRPDWNLQENVYTFATGLVRSFAVTAALGFVFRIETKMDQGVVALAGFHDDVATLAAISAGWPSARDKFLPAEGEAAIATVA